jgi:lysozyme
LKPSINCINLIKTFEGYRPNAYVDSVGVVTIGYGSTHWMDGKKIRLGEKITLEGAELLLHWELNKSNVIDDLSLNQNQYDALTSFIYNCGVNAFSKSTLFKKIKINPNDIQIKNEFIKWNKGNGKVIKGLTNRRNAEAELYYKKNG